MKRVSFHPYVQIVEVLNMEDYTPREIEAAWHSEEEMEKITERCSKVVRSMDTGRGKKYCIRGLEGHSKLGSVTKNRNRRAAWAAVLTKQAQWVENTSSEQAIADAYQRTTSSCQMWAQVTGRSDQQVANSILFEDEEEGNDQVSMSARSRPSEDMAAEPYSSKVSSLASSSLAGPSSIPSQRLHAGESMSQPRLACAAA